ncbi:TPA: hypothetical protein SI347_004712 [Escherichia coli]|nr:hypothetical protein [Escherichia coli]
MTFEELAAKGAELVNKRNKATGSERELLNKEIASIRQAQIQALSAECVEAFNIAIPAMVEQAIQSSDVVKAIEQLQRG